MKEALKEDQWYGEGWKKMDQEGLKIKEEMGIIQKASDLIYSSCWCWDKK